MDVVAGPKTGTGFSQYFQLISAIHRMKDPYCVSGRDKTKANVRALSLLMKGIQSYCRMIASTLP
jgi:hypothetical protein